MRTLVDHQGRVGTVVPTGIATDDTTKLFFQDIVETHSLVSLFDFENKNIFPNVHSSLKFCLLTLRAAALETTPAAKFAFYCHAVSEIEHKTFLLSSEDIATLNLNPTREPVRCFANRRMHS